VLPLPQPPSGPGVGIPDVALPVVGEGYEAQAEIAAAVHKSYGTDRPQYAHPAIGGIDHPAGTHQPALRHVVNLGADGLFIGAPARQRTGSWWCRRRRGRRCCRGCSEDSAAADQRPRACLGYLVWSLAGAGVPPGGLLLAGRTAPGDMAPSSGRWRHPGARFPAAQGSGPGGWGAGAHGGLPDTSGRRTLL
jgi:hypothetical protein